MRAAYSGLTVISFVSFCWTLWGPDRSYPSGSPYQFVPFALHVVCQGILMIWCIRDISRRTFANSAATLNWAAAVVFLGVFGTTIYALRVKRRQWIPHQAPLRADQVIE